jgi:hypothetical protein
MYLHWNICIGLPIGLYILIQMSLGCSFHVLGIVSSNYHIILFISSSSQSRPRLCKRQQWLKRLGTNTSCMLVLPRISLNIFLRMLRKLLTRLFLIVQFFKHWKIPFSRRGHFPTQQWIPFISKQREKGGCFLAWSLLWIEQSSILWVLVNM